MYRLSRVLETNNLRFNDSVSGSNPGWKMANSGWESLCHLVRLHVKIQAYACHLRGKVCVEILFS